jgi:hypothetical protein
VVLKVGSDYSGQKGTCPGCKKEIIIPEKSEEIQETTEEATEKE